MSTDMHMRVGSITKTFTATVVLQLVDEGKLALADTIDRYAIDVPGAAQITIRNLLDMTSGLVNYTNTEAFGKVLLADPTGTMTLDELIAYAADPAEKAPSKRGDYFYCNTNYIILATRAEPDWLCDRCHVAGAVPAWLRLHHPR
jgi:D-alanyl-D-alanine carboxypeptidase